MIKIKRKEITKMSEERKELFIKCLKAFPQNADELAVVFGVSKRSLAAYKANLTMGRY